MSELKVVEREPCPTYSILSIASASLPEQYIALIFVKWLKSLRFGNPAYQHVPSDTYYRDYHKFIENLLAKPDSVVRLAVLSDDHDVVLGFSVSREDVIDYLYVHKDHRRQGIAKSLMPEGITTMSHATLTSLKIWQRNPKYRYLKFNPHA